MMLRRAFTLMEVLVAIVLAGVVALLVYGIAGAAIDTQRRLVLERQSLQSARAIRAVLTDALRNARPATRFGESAFSVEAAADGAGQPLDRLSFVSAGGTPPFTSDVNWQVTVAASADGLVMTGTPVGLADPRAVSMSVPGITRLEIQTLRYGTTRWSADRGSFAQLPRAVRIVFHVDSGAVIPAIQVGIPWATGQ
jgi:prepilin-type N-terminal cleavage/methylation domain-containing protein